MNRHSEDFSAIPTEKGERFRASVGRFVAGFIGLSYANDAQSCTMAPWQKLPWRGWLTITGFSGDLVLVR